MNLESYTTLVQNETGDQSNTGKTQCEQSIKEIYQEFLREAYKWLIGSSSEDTTVTSGTALYTPSSFTSIVGTYYKSTTSDTWCKLAPISEQEYLDYHQNDVDSTPRYYFVQGTKVQLVPAPNEAGTMRVVYMPLIPELETGVTSLVPDRFTDVIRMGASWKKLSFDNDPRAENYLSFYMSAKRNAILELTNRQEETLRPRLFKR
jgi:hypothetical protein